MTDSIAPRTHVKPVRNLLQRLARVNVPRGDGMTLVTLASVALVLLFNEAATGILLALYYRPTVADANASVRFVVTDVEFGALVRALHYWGAQALILFLGGSLAWALMRRTYRSPNSAAWAAAVVLTIVVVGETVSGGMLPWTHRSVVEAQISSTLAGQLPLVGPLLRGLMLGGPEPGDIALVRILGFHAGILPTTTLLLVTFFALHTAGCAPPVPSPSTLPLAPHAALRASAAAGVVFMGLIALSALVPPGLTGSAEVARASADGLRPSWYLMFLHQLLRAAPAHMLGVPGARVVGVSLALFLFALALFPLADRKASRAGQIVVLVALIAIAGGAIRAFLA